MDLLWVLGVVIVFILAVVMAAMASVIVIGALVVVSTLWKLLKGKL